MKVYIASHDQTYAQELAIHLKSLGHAIVSEWVFHATEFGKPHTDAECRRIADGDLSDVERCDVLVLIGGTEKRSGGKFIEAGYAMGMGKPVWVLGRRENTMLHHPSIRFAATIPDLFAESQ